MLPDNTEVGVMSWRALVRGMQVLGMFPYIVPKTGVHTEPQFSLILCLWGIFVQLFAYGAAIDLIRFWFAPLLSPNIGSVTFAASLSSIHLSSTIASTIMLVNSKHLASLLADFSTTPKQTSDVDKQRFPKRRLCSALILNLGLNIFGLWYFVGAPFVRNTVIFVYFTLYSQVIFWSLIASIDLSNKSFDLLSSQILVIARDTVKTSTSLLDPVSGDLVHEEDIKTVLFSLQEMDRKIRQVSKCEIL